MFRPDASTAAADLHDQVVELLAAPQRQRARR
jgi:hypothetical protein